MARRISVEITGDASSLERSFKRAGSAGSNFNREISRSFRGAAAGSGIFRSLGRSLAFASGGFLAFATAGEAIRKSIDAATEAAATQRQLAAQFRANGQSLSTYRSRIEEATLATSKLSGFTRDELDQAFLTAFRGSKDVSVGLKVQTVAANAARGAHKGLAVVALGLTKAYLGQGTALRRLGILIPKGVSGMKALEFVQRRFAGQAAAGTTAQERFGAALQNTEVTIGTALLPSLTKYLNRATDWLDNQKNQERIQRDVSQAVKTATGIFNGFADAVKAVAGPTQALVNALGGARNAAKLLLEVLVARRLYQFATAETLIGTAAEGAAAKVGLLRGALGKLGAIGAITVGLDVVQRNQQQHGGGLSGVARGIGAELQGKAGLGPQGVLQSSLRMVGVSPAHARLASRVEGDMLTFGLDEAIKAVPGIFRSAPKPRIPAGDVSGALGLGPRGFIGTAALKPTATTARATTPLRSTALGFKNRFAQQELSLAQAQLTTQQADDRKVLVAEAASIRERIKRIHGSQKHLAEETQLTQQLGSIQSQITQIDQQSLQSTTRWRRLELALAQAQLTQTQSDDKKILQAEAGVIRARLASLAKTRKTLDERTALTQQLVGIEGQIQSIDQQALDKRKAAIAKHLQAVKQKEQHLKQQIAQITQQFSQALDTARSALGELFQGPVLAPTEAQAKAKLGLKGPDAKTLTKDLNAQVAQYARFQHDLAILAKRGASKQLLKELRAKGTEALPEIEALAKASPKDLKAFFKAFGKGEKLVQQVAKIDMKAQLVTLRADKLQLQHLRGHEGGKAGQGQGRAQAHHHLRARKMAQGGFGTVTSPTLFVAGESGAEDFAFSPRSRGGFGRGGSDNQPILNVIQIDGQQFARVMTNRQKRNTELGVSQVRGRHGGRNAMGPV